MQEYTNRTHNQVLSWSCECVLWYQSSQTVCCFWGNACTPRGMDYQPPDWGIVPGELGFKHAVITKVWPIREPHSSTQEVQLACKLIVKWMLGSSLDNVYCSPAGGSSLGDVYCSPAGGSSLGDVYCSPAGGSSLDDVYCSPAASLWVSTTAFPSLCFSWFRVH